MCVEMHFSDPEDFLTLNGVEQNNAAAETKI